jgi:rhodanese-related sulfurtransferase
MYKILIVTLIALFAMSGLVYAENPIVPDGLSGAKVINAEECKKLIGGNGKAFDVRNELEYGEGHLPGAIMLPYKEKSDKAANFDSSVDKFDISKLPSDKSIPVVFYCNGDRCWKSYKSSVAAIRAGYKNVNWFRGGLPEWKEKGYPIEK